MEVSYDPEEDILLIVLTSKKGKKIDDTLEGENILVSVTEDREPIILEVFQASNLLKEVLKVMLTRDKKGVSIGPMRSVSVSHQVKK